MSGYTGFKHPNGRLIKKGTRKMRGQGARMRQAENVREHEEVLRDPTKTD